MVTPSAANIILKRITALDRTENDTIKIPSTHVDIFENCRNCRLLDESEVKQIIDDAPTVDAVPVVRCKDCKYVCDYTDIYPKSEGYKCIKNGKFHDENWYCADGERKTDDRT